MPLPSAPPLIPERYYLDHFRQVIDAIRTRYAFLLSVSEGAWLDRLDQMPEPALCLYARLVNRRGPCFRVEKLHYPEIGDVPAALAVLLANGLLLPCQGTIARSDRLLLLSGFTHRELAAALHPHAPRGGRKEALLGWLESWESGDAWVESFLAKHPTVRTSPQDPWPFFRFLFFGELTENLSAFVTRDLGHWVPETVAPLAFSPRFSSREEAVETYRLSCLYEEFRARREGAVAIDLLAWWRSQGIRRENLPSPAQRLFDRLADRLGRRLEREGEAAAAITLYAESPTAPCRERQARLLMKAGDTLSALALLHEIEADPTHAEEAYAAAQLIARLEQGRRSDARAYHVTSPQMILEYDEGRVEQAVLAHHARADWHGVHAENWLWNALFGLLLWEVIYDPSHGGFHSPLQTAPSDVMEKSFYPRRQDAIEARLSLLANPSRSRAQCGAILQAKQGIANPFVYWHPDLPDIIEVMLRRVPGDGLAAVLRRMAQDVKRRRRGFPDLFLWRGESEYRFVEVKSETDHLSPHQYQWLDFFAGAGIDVTLERVHRPAAVFT